MSQAKHEVALFRNSKMCSDPSDKMRIKLHCELTPYRIKKLAAAKAKPPSYTEVALWLGLQFNTAIELTLFHVLLGNSTGSIFIFVLAALVAQSHNHE